jgi:SAM-dependent methyltransferase
VLAEGHGSPLLELGCGSGRVLRHLAGTGQRAFGLDDQLDPLALLRRDWLLDEAPPVFLADMGAFHLQAAFGLIFVPCNTFSTLDQRQRAATLACVFRHLRPGGAFVACLPNPISLRRVPSRGETEVEEAFPHPLDGSPVQVSSAWERGRRLFKLTWHYDHLLPDGAVERLSAHTAHWLVSREVYTGELARAGFSAITTWGDIDFTAYEQGSPQLILYARKPACPSS